MIASELTEAHIQQALQQIDDEGVPDRRKSRRYDLMVRGKAYPPKYVVSLATALARDSESVPGFNAVEAKNYFVARDYEIRDRQSTLAFPIIPEDDESRFSEGKARYKLHRTMERDSRIVRKAKEQRLSATGKLECDVCSLDFKRTYGSRGEGFIEAHHTIPVASLAGKRKTKLSDLALVCSNCHRMLHRGKPMLSVEQLRRIVRDGQEQKSSCAITVRADNEDALTSK